MSRKWHSWPTLEEVVQQLHHGAVARILPEALLGSLSGVGEFVVELALTGGHVCNLVRDVPSHTSTR